MTSLRTVGDHFPHYSATAVMGGDLSDADPENPYDYFMTASDEDASHYWRVVLFWPRDSQPSSQIEVAAFGIRHADFAIRGAQLLGVSVDTKYTHFHWRVTHEDLKRLPFPILSDFNQVLTRAAGVLGAAGVADRAVFIVDPLNVIRHVSVSAGADHDVDDVLRVLDELRDDRAEGTCPLTISQSFTSAIGPNSSAGTSGDNGSPA